METFFSNKISDSAVDKFIQRSIENSIIKGEKGVTMNFVKG